ncbi:MAG: hypothetical protein HY904_10245 [Deltaproteobacteria bacterium]|nr:hypothetical protein [Deltaproteobacteria bacterium]
MKSFAACGRAGMEQFEQQLLAILTRHLSVPTAKGMIGRAREKAGIPTDRPATPADLPRMVGQLEAGVRLFAPEAAREPMLQALRRLQDGPANLPPVTRDVRDENGILQVRSDVLSMCESAGAGSLSTQKAMTLVSELARNIVNYTLGGKVRLELTSLRPLRLRITATDQGGGIPNLEEILTGNYRSKTGMGRGILGAKRLSNNFDIKTGAAGTRVEAELSL